jgi:beta-glucosidase
VVLLNIGGVIETATWETPARRYPLRMAGGQEGGNSVADVISARLRHRKTHHDMAQRLRRRLLINQFSIDKTPDLDLTNQGKAATMRKT